MWSKALAKLNKINVLLDFAGFLVLITRKCSVEALEIKVFLNMKDSKSGYYKPGSPRWTLGWTLEG